MIETMNLAEIKNRIDAISEVGSIRMRMRMASPQLASAMGGAAIDFLSKDERHELHLLQLRLPTFAQEWLEAHERIQQRIAARKRGKVEILAT